MRCSHVLRAGGFAAEHGGSPEEAIDGIRQREFDLALLDIENLSGMYVAEFCHQIRAIGKPIGILLITGTHVETEIVQALEAGADDYISKPFRTADLISRCQVVVHRVRTIKALEENTFTVGDLQLDLDRRQLRKVGRIVHLTPTEFSLLTFLMKNQGTALTHSQLLRTIRGGFGIFTMTNLGQLSFNTTNISVGVVRTTGNTLQNGQAAYQFPNVTPPVNPQAIAGTGDFYQNTPITYRDPQSAQWNLTVERGIVSNTTLRVSYVVTLVSHEPNGRSEPGSTQFDLAESQSTALPQLGTDPFIRK